VECAAAVEFARVVWVTGNHELLDRFVVGHRLFGDEYPSGRIRFHEVADSWHVFGECRTDQI
jgi:hypothetical protein